MKLQAGPQRSRQGERGITLLEVLVALALLGLVLTGLSVMLPHLLALRAGAATIHHDMEQLRAGNDFLRSALSQIVSADQGGGMALPAGGLGLEGMPDQLSATVFLPPGVGTGPQRLHLSVQDGAVIMLLSSVQGTREQEQRVVIASAPRSLGIAYHDGRTWLDHWTGRADLPAMIRITLGGGLPGRPWPPLHIRQRLEFGAICAVDRTAAGCGLGGRP